MDTDVGRVPAEPGAREPSQQAVSAVPASPPRAEPRTHLIYSGKWKMWHCRSGDGAARGYTRDIVLAGVFETSTALAYGQGDDNEAVDAEDAIERLADERHATSTRLRIIDEQCALLAQGIEAAAADETRSGSAEGESPVRDSECAQKSATRNTAMNEGPTIEAVR